VTQVRRRNHSESGPSLREQQKHTTRRALLNAARSAFEELGYTAVTIDDIASRAGASRGTFYVYFTKASVLKDLLQQSFEGSDAPNPASLVDDLLELDLTDLAVLRNWLTAYVHAWRTERLLAKAWMEGDAHDIELQKMTDWRIERATGTLTDIILANHRRAGASISPKKARAHATLMDIQLQYFCHHALGRGHEVDLDAGIEALAENWYTALSGAHPAGQGQAQ
jgi:AcrR family transcriptional regulator